MKDKIEKNFKNLDEQVNILKFKGLQINDENYAKKVLLRENYFFLMGYRHLFMEPGDKHFVKGATFEELYSLFLFDRSIRNVLFKYILVIENNLKSITSYQLSKKYGYKEKDYLKAKNFTPEPNKQAQVSSFGIVSEMFSILKPEDQKDIANAYDIDTNSLIVYLPILANYRNLCAHEDILYENKTQKLIDDTVYHKLLNIKQEDELYTQGKNDVFALIIIMKQLLNNDDFKNMTFELDHIIETLNFNLRTININKVLDRMGFPDNWKNLASIERSKDLDEA